MQEQAIFDARPSGIAGDGRVPKQRGRWFRRGDQIVVVLNEPLLHDGREFGHESSELAETSSGARAGTSPAIAAALDRKQWSVAVRLAIASGKRDENFLTDLLFNARHPERRGERLRATERQLIQEWFGLRDGLIRPALRATLTGDTRIAPSSSGKPAWVQTVLPLLNRYRGDIPLDFLLGWIAVESGGRISDTTSLDERGYFQLHPDESKTLGIDHNRLSRDPDYSVQAGLQLVQHDARWAQALGFKYGSDLFWHVVKLRHWLPAGVSAIVQDMRQHGVAANSWEELKNYAVANRSRINALIRKMAGRWGPKWDPKYGVDFVDKMFQMGRQLAAGI